MRPGYAAEDGAALHFNGDRAEPGGRLAAAAPAATGSTSSGTGGGDADRHRLPRRAAASAAGSHGDAPDAAAAIPRRARRPRCARSAGRGASSPSAATTSPRARPTARSASCCCGWRPSAAAGGRGSASCRPRAATPPSRSAASTPPSASGPASPPTSRSSGSAAGRWRCATTCSPRTWSTSAAAACVNLLAVWEAHEHRRHPQPRLAPGDRPRRPERRRDVLVRGRDHQVLGQAAGRRRPRPARRQPLRPLQQRARAPRRLPRGGRRRDAGRLRPRRLRRPALGGRGRPLGGDRPPRRPRLPGGARDGGVTESPLPARFLPAPAPAALREDIAEFRRITSMRKRAGWLG